MSSSATALLSQVMDLSPAEREELYLRLADSLFEPASAPSDASKAAWEDRWQEIASGKVTPRDAFEVLQEVRSRHGV